MIIFLSDGRLGNQLFQYAFLNTIAKEKEIILTANMEQLVDKFEIGNKFFRHLKLGKFSLFFTKKILKPYFLQLLVKMRIFSYIKQERNEISVLPSYKEKNGFLPITLVETNFFQSESFFDNEKVNFKIKERYIQEAEEFFQSTPKDTTNIFVHVRRGDYIFESYLGEQGIELPKEYFEKAIEEIAKDIENPFFIFLSDDPGYVECCFKDLENKIVSKNSMATDLAIMNLCEYGVVSNSSFSWWGAYMMQSRKKVIFPKYWYGWKQKIESHIGIQPTWSEVIEVEK